MTALQAVTNVNSLQLVVKLSERCNINCSYCYYFNGDIDVSSNRPALLLKEAQIILPRWIKQAVADFDINRIHISFHGGEPTLARPERVRSLIDALLLELRPPLEVQFSIQTNGVALSEAWIDLIVEKKIGVGFSIDGSPEVHDISRVDRKGRPTSATVEASIRRLHLRLSQSPHGGTSSSITVLSDLSTCENTYDYFATLGLDSVSMLLPDLNHEHFGPQSSGADDAYGHTLAKTFASWLFGEGTRPDFIQGQMFLNRYLRARQGLSPGSIADGHLINNLILIVHTDLKVGIDDSLMPAGSWYQELQEFDLSEHSLKAIVSSGTFDRYREIYRDLPTICQTCRWSLACGGGDVEHRYSKANAFDNPSVYCRSYKLVFEAIETVVRTIEERASMTTEALDSPT